MQGRADSWLCNRLGSKGQGWDQIMHKWRLKQQSLREAALGLPVDARARLLHAGSAATRSQRRVDDAVHGGEVEEGGQRDKGVEDLVVAKHLWGGVGALEGVHGGLRVCGVVVVCVWSVWRR